MSDYIIITGDNCSYCDKAKELLTFNGMTYSEINLMDSPDAYTIMVAAGRKTVPLILQVVGGCDDLEDLLEEINAA